MKIENMQCSGCGRKVGERHRINCPVDAASNGRQVKSLLDRLYIVKMMKILFGVFLLSFAWAAILVAFSGFAEVVSVTTCLSSFVIIIIFAAIYIMFSKD